MTQVLTEKSKKTPAAESKSETDDLTKKSKTKISTRKSGDNVRKGGTPAAKVSEQGRKATPFSLDNFQIPAKIVERKATILENVEWVAQHMDAKLHKKMVEKAPSSAAISMLKFFRRGKNDALFWRYIYSKRIPSLSQVKEEDTGSHKDTDELQSKIDKVKAVYAKGQK